MLDEKLDALAQAQQQFKKNYKFRSLRHSIGTEVIFAVTCIIMTVILSMFISIHPIRGDGMTPTFKKGDYVITNSLAYSKRTPVRGDVVSIKGRLLRITGLPGDEIYINGGRLYINGALAVESYIDDGVYTYPTGSQMKFTLSDDEYFVLCDNRYCTDDSRDGTLIHLSDIDGKIIGKF